MDGNRYPMPQRRPFLRLPVANIYAGGGEGGGSNLNVMGSALAVLRQVLPYAEGVSVVVKYHLRRRENLVGSRVHHLTSSAPSPSRPAACSRTSRSTIAVSSSSPTRTATSSRSAEPST